MKWYWVTGNPMFTRRHFSTITRTKYTVTSVKRTLNKNSKHCGQCDRCVSNFDHHCKWLNNCIGEKNYKYFMWLIWVFFVHNIFVIGICLIQIIDFHVADVEFSASKANLKEYYNSKHGTALRIISYVGSWLLLLLCILKAFSTGHLIVFHIYLKCHNLTTYKYIMIQRK